MATNLNRGNQLLTVDYKLPIQSQRFNEFLRDLIYPGIYRGVNVTVIDTDTIQISPGNIWFNSETGAGINVISVKVRLQSAFQMDVEPANPVLYTRLTWSNVTDNFAEFDYAPDLDSLPTNALVVAELLFDGGNNLIGVDYSNRSRGSLDWNASGELTTTLPPSEDWHVGNEKWNRDKYLRYVTQPINGNRLITSISSNATISGNTTVYESDIVITGNSVLIPYDVEITGDLFVQGTTTTINSQTLEIEDKNIEIAKVNTPTDITADGGGITLKGATDKTIDWTQSGSQWNSSEHWNLAVGKEYRINGIKVMDSTSLGSGIVSAPGISQIGTITGGTWQGDVIATNYGGTGQSSYVDGEILIGKTNGSLAKKTIDGTTNQVNVANGDGTITLSTPQDIHTGASPTFSGLNLLGDITTNDTNKRIFSGLGNKILDIADSNSTVKVRGILEVSGNSVLQSLDVLDNSIELNKVTSPSDANADNGGLIVKGSTDKTFTYDNSGSKYWESSENINLVSGKSYFINGVDVMTQALGKQDNLTNPYVTISSVGAVNNLDTTTNNYVKLSASTSLTGIVAPTATKNAVIIRNTNSVNLFIENESLSSTASNRILTGTGSSIKLSQDASVILTYDLDSSRWIVVGGSGGGGGGSSIEFISTLDAPLGSPVYFDGSVWALAVASNETTSVQYIISEKVGSGTFTYTAVAQGEVELLTTDWDTISGETGGLTSGATYYLSSSTPGMIQTTPGLLNAPVLRALSTTKAFISLSINNTESGMGDTFYRDTVVTVGDTTTLTLTYPPSGKAYVWLSLDGVFQSGTAFDLAGQTITFGGTIPTGVTIDVLYARAVLLADPGAINRMVSFAETVSGSPKTVFNLPSVPSGVGSCIAFVGGSIQDSTKWNLNGNVITFTDPVPVGVQVVVYVLNSSGVTQIDSYVTREQHTISSNGTITLTDVFGSTVSGRYRFHELTDPLLEGKILLKYNGVGVDPDVRVVTESSDVTTTFDTASKLNMYITGNVFTIQNKFATSKTLVFFREI